MTTFFSPGQRGFYDDSVHAEMPDDCVEITPERYAELLEGQALGQRIVADEDGTPTLGEQVQPAATEVSARRQRDALLAASDWTQGRDVPESISQRWAGYRQALREIPEQSGFPTEVDWPEAP